MRKELELALVLARELDAADLPRLLGDLEEIRAVAVMRLTTRVDKSQSVELLDVQQVADRLRMSRDYVYRNARRFPFFCANGSGRSLRFSSEKLDAYIRARTR